MLFNSYEFIFVFLPISFFVYFYLNAKRLTEAGKGWLVFSSLFFYSWWNVANLPLILSSMLFNYVAGKMISRQSADKKGISRKSILIAGIALNLALLAYYKYSDFFIANLNSAIDTQFQPLHLALPLAISFFTFQQIAYLVDSYRRQTHEYDFLNYSVFVCFFPQLIAGPIVHHKEMMPQFANIRTKLINYKNIRSGIFIFCIGLFKKTVIADTFAVWANNGFDTATSLNLIEAWVTSFSYTFQLYFDFSGYTDMAIGLALLFNIKIPQNFNSPYKARDIQDFWKRWHITLSRFLRDYVYIPLGGNRHGNYRTYANLMITFLLGGLWHGAGWTFVFWGFLHGTALVMHRIWRALGFRMWGWLAWLVTLCFINITWVFFRAKEWADADKVLSAMFDIHHIVLPNKLSDYFQFLTPFGLQFGEWAVDISGSQWTATWIMAGIVTTLFLKNSTERLFELKSNYRSSVFAGLCFCGGILSINKVSEFLYFNF